MYHDRQVQFHGQVKLGELQYNLRLNNAPEDIEALEVRLAGLNPYAARLRAIDGRIDPAWLRDIATSDARVPVTGRRTRKLAPPPGRVPTSTVPP